ncbi:MAG: monovalent cation/H+ antiporter complex subunit F [Vicinamibacterales bacterium]|jgi:multicomponent Na+:H+ antiporter subunit F|nr:pH regulation protein F [Acidobacteriota bacterium]MDP7293788.1 monovalent cation/H+ antiporter complex subunit F [Vicinamibacterales bacterium]MDP7470877.1 monovalent cation/H+ antiporter complex subunit F [Vicinamibacterales bacterium]MDP7670955.1 monovalent cation/H+ antiporter complex subunit F [Vicinamibacterales bacterium]HJO39699.1 monovalent cation/H+ antiporter complex subunit F [Vicinamibacterales bacterium]
MSPLLLGTAFALTAAMTVSLYRVLAGPTVFDRLTGLGLISTKTIVLLLVLGFLTDRVEVFVDITLSYTLISFVGTLALAKYYEIRGTDQP